MMRRLILFLPLLVVLAVCFLLLGGLNQDPKKLASALIDKPVPEFYQADLFDTSRTLSPRDFPKEPFLINIWGSWCDFCRIEHPLLLDISKEVNIVGVDYRDNPENGREMLSRQGNPYFFVIDDSRGELSLKLGVDGAPETYLVDANGVIRYRHSGLLERETWQNIFLLKLQELRKQ